MELKELQTPSLSEDTAAALCKDVSVKYRDKHMCVYSRALSQYILHATDQHELF